MANKNPNYLFASISPIPSPPAPLLYRNPTPISYKSFPPVPIPSIPPLAKIILLKDPISKSPFSPARSSLSARPNNDTSPPQPTYIFHAPRFSPGVVPSGRPRPRPALPESSNCTLPSLAPVSPNELAATSGARS